VSAEQSASSGLARHAPPTGRLGSNVTVGLQMDVGGRYSVVAGVGSARLTGGALSSPLQPQRTFATANVFVTRRF
jgi:outer membrane scaffolding protein for murein synthesis (MipA/OmpV family)